MEERFKRLLQEKGLSAAQFADLIEVNASAMSHILNGRNKPSFNVIAKIAQTFPDINLNFLISGKGALYNNQSEILNKPQIETIRNQSAALSSEEPIKSPAPQQPIPPIATIANQTIESVTTEKRLKRILLFFEDGTFEDYTK